MKVPSFIRFSMVPLAMISLFVFPWPLTLVLMAAAGLVFPPTPFFIGVLADFLYYPGFSTGAWLHGTIIGLILSIVTFGVQYFVKTRIM